MDEAFNFFEISNDDILLAAHHLFAILLSTSGRETEASVLFFKSLVSEENQNIGNDENLVEDDHLFDNSKSKFKTLHRQSPFYTTFLSVFNVVSSSVSTFSDICDVNTFHHPKFASFLLERFFPICPLWMTELMGSRRCSNTAVESWFKIVKNHVLAT